MAKATNLDGDPPRPRTKDHSNTLVEVLELGTVWIEYGLVGDIIVSFEFRLFYFIFRFSFSFPFTYAISPSRPSGAISSLYFYILLLSPAPVVLLLVAVAVVSQLVRLSAPCTILHRPSPSWATVLPPQTARQKPTPTP